MGLFSSDDDKKSSGGGFFGSNNDEGPGGIFRKREDETTGLRGQSVRKICTKCGKVLSKCTCPIPVEGTEDPSSGSWF